MDETVYKTGDAQALFGVSSETIRRWSETFKNYLTPEANPDKGVTRLYTLADLRVLALVADMMKRDATFDEVEARLAAGDRGSVVLPVGKMPHELGRDIQIEMLAQQLELTQQQKQELSLVIAEKDKTITELQTRLDEREGNEDKLQEQIDQLQKEIIQLNRKLAVLEYLMDEKKEGE